MNLPPRLVERIRNFESGAETPAEPRNAATVVLLRPGQASEPGGRTCPEIYLMRREMSMAAFGGMWVFPGGGVDASDAEPDLAWAGPSPAEWAERLAVDEPLARELVCAAVRETFEESGVLLAGPDATSVVADTSGDDWEADRVALEAHTLSFHDFLLRRGLVLRTDLLGAWSGWLTPIFEKRRFRTWFFVAVLPEGQLTRDISTEASAVEWRTAESAAREALAGNVMMLPPTFATCLEIAQYDSPLAVLAQAQGRRVEMFMPEVIEVGDTFALSQPDYLTALMANSPSLRKDAR